MDKFGALNTLVCVVEQSSFSRAALHMGKTPSAVAKAIAALGTAVLAGGDALREVEVNPLLVMPQGKGAVAVDVRVLWREDAQGA